MKKSSKKTANELDERLRNVCLIAARKFYCRSVPAEDFDDVVQDAIVVVLEERFKPPKDERESRLIFRKIYFRLIDKLRERTHGRTLKKAGKPIPVFLNSTIAIQSGDAVRNIFDDAIAKESLKAYEEHRREEARDCFSYYVDENGKKVRKTISENALSQIVREALASYSDDLQDMIKRRLSGESPNDVAQATRYSLNTVYAYTTWFRQKCRDAIERYNQ